MVRAAIADLTTATHAVLRESTIEVLEPSIVSNPNFPSQTTLDWDNPIVVGEGSGTLQPASARALERVGRVGLVNAFEVFMDPLPVRPAQRLRVGARVFRVLESRVWRSHASAVVEEVTEGGSGS